MLPPKALREAPSSLLQLLVSPGVLGVLGLCGHLPSVCSVVTLSHGCLLPVLLSLGLFCWLCKDAGHTGLIQNDPVLTNYICDDPTFKQCHISKQGFSTSFGRHDSVRTELMREGDTAWRYQGSG